MANAVTKRYQGEEHFVDGYVPQSLNAEYSSLHRSITWIGMGLILASLPFWGTFVFGLATTVFADETEASHSHGYLAENAANYSDYTGGLDFSGSVFLWGGLIAAICFVIAGICCIKVGRRAYKAYLKEFGTKH